MRRRPLISKDYAEHWSEEPRSQQYQNFYLIVEIVFRKLKKILAQVKYFSLLVEIVF